MHAAARDADSSPHGTICCDHSSGGRLAAEGLVLFSVADILCRHRAGEISVSCYCKRLKALILLSALMTIFLQVDSATAKSGRSAAQLDCAYSGTCKKPSIKDLDCAYSGTCDKPSIKDLDCSYSGTCGQQGGRSKAIQAMEIAKRRRLAAQRRQQHLRASVHVTH